jgi:hypothetical protein
MYTSFSPSLINYYSSKKKKKKKNYFTTSYDEDRIAYYQSLAELLAIGTE